MPEPDARIARRYSPMIGVIVCAGLLALMFLGLWYLANTHFLYGSAMTRPIWLVVGLLVVATLVSWVAVRWGLRVPTNSKPLVVLIFGVGVGLRLLMLDSSPILEIDLYRYMWDGKVTSIGVSPYRFSPAEVLQGNPAGAEDYQRVAALAHRSESNQTIVRRVHFKDYTTIYPPVSQFCFWLAMRGVPENASVSHHRLAMKSVLLLFDLLTMVLVLGLLRSLRRHPAWWILYAWSPLVIKEIANSGHLDSIATCLVTGSILSLVRWGQFPEPNGWRRGGGLILSGILLGLAVGAKLFPLILIPAFLATLWTAHRRAALIWLLTTLVVAGASMLPMAPRLLEDSPTATGVIRATAPGEAERLEGLTGFLSHWRMNDALFSFFYHNAAPDSSSVTDRPWYVVIPNEWRIEWHQRLQGVSLLEENPPYLTARILTLALFAVAYLVVLWPARNRRLDALPGTMLSLMAVFFLLQPTQNPWYWVWAMPLMAFARNRGWNMVSLTLMLYYSRFWFRDLTGTYWVGSLEYTGAGLFQHVVAWVELGLVLTALAWGATRGQVRAPDVSAPTR